METASLLKYIQVMTEQSDLAAIHALERRVNSFVTAELTEKMLTSIDDKSYSVEEDFDTGVFIRTVEGKVILGGGGYQSDFSFEMKPGMIDFQLQKAVRDFQQAMEASCSKIFEDNSTLNLMRQMTSARHNAEIQEDVTFNAESGVVVYTMRFVPTV